MDEQSPGAANKSTSPPGTPKPETKTFATPYIEVCPVCSESRELAQIKGCLRCLKCGFKWDCNGW